MSAPPAPPAARRIRNTNSSTSRITGPNESSSVARSERPSSTGSALTTTSWSIRSCRSSSSANAGRSVSNAVFFVSDPSGYVTSFLNVPWIVSPRDVTSLTFPAVTCSRNSVYGTSRRSLPDGISETMNQFSASSASRIHQKRDPPGMRGIRPRSPAPWGGGAPSTRHSGPRSPPGASVGGRRRGAGADGGSATR